MTGSSQDDRLFMMGFNLVKGVGYARLNELRACFGSLAEAWHANEFNLIRSGLNPKIIENIVQVRKKTNLKEKWDEFNLKGIRILTTLDDDYPRLLKETGHPPPVLYVRGRFEIADDWSVAIVGTRKNTAYGKQVTEDLATLLAGYGITVVSGLARGIDVISHHTMIKNGGRTIAVLGSGVDIIYPPEHTLLAEQIIKSGAIISDYAPGTPPESSNFPPRNRIISGLARAVVVVEAGDKSGALITATFAAEQNREVLAVPGGIFAVQSRGTNRLIEKGARPLLCPEDVLDAIGYKNRDRQIEVQKSLPRNPTESTLVKYLGAEPVHVDEICNQSGISINEVVSTLAILELKGVVRQVNGLNYVLASRLG